MQQLARQRDMYKVLAQKGGVMVVRTLSSSVLYFFLALTDSFNKVKTVKINFFFRFSKVLTSKMQLTKAK